MHPPRRNRIGIFGGTFDPPHLGHLILAQEILELFGLQSVYFMPCNRPPHKDRPDLTDANHRYAMVVAATAQNPDFVASPVEVNRPGPSYSIDTLGALRDDLGAETEMLFVAGLDSFLEIETWKDWEDLLDLCHFIVVGRPGHGFDEIPRRLPGWVLERIVDLREREVDPREILGVATGEATGPTPEAVGAEEGGGSSASSGPRADSSWNIFLSDAVKVDISSTEIRRRVREGRGIRYRVLPEVERYIRTHGLYRDGAATKEAAS